MVGDHLTLPERISILETRQVQYDLDMKEIKEKLDDLVQLKSKGVGAIWLMSLIIGSGLFGFFNFVVNFFTVKPPHS